ncbi:hypothetical protein SERLA73DRAFT_129885, partial [Serpula lacrymans var. lacrymans S7.3]
MTTTGLTSSPRDDADDWEKRVDDAVVVEVETDELDCLAACPVLVFEIEGEGEAGTGEEKSL